MIRSAFLLAVLVLSGFCGCQSAADSVEDAKDDTVAESSQIETPAEGKSKAGKMTKALLYLRNYVASQNEAQKKFQTDYYRYLVEQDDTDGDTLEDHLSKHGLAFQQHANATAQQIAALEKRAAVKLPKDLVQFYHEIGAFDGRDVFQSIHFHLPSCNELLADFDSESKSDRLSSLGLPDGIRYSWGNSRPELVRGGDGLPEEKFDRLVATYKWFGSISDGSFESGLHFAFDNEGRYCVFYWHQDTQSDLKPDVVYKGEFAELLKQCIEGYQAVRDYEEAEEEGEEPDVYFDLEDLAPWLEKKLSENSDEKSQP